MDQWCGCQCALLYLFVSLRKKDQKYIQIQPISKIKLAYVAQHIIGEEYEGYIGFYIVEC